MSNLREDFDRWLITATFQEKIQLASLGVFLAIGVLGVISAMISRGAPVEQ